MTFLQLILKSSLLDSGLVFIAEKIVRTTLYELTPKLGGGLV